MRRGRRERVLAACLWMLLFLSAAYVSDILFPKQTASAGYAAVVGAEHMVKQVLGEFSEVMVPAVQYIINHDMQTECEHQTLANDPSYTAYRMMAEEWETMRGTAAAEENLKEVDIQEQTNAVSAFITDRHTRFLEMSQRGGWDFNEMMQFDSLLNKLYVVSEGTSITGNELNPEKLISYDLSVTPQGGYDILIYHTHSQEAYADSVPGDVSQTIVGMGELLKQYLEGYGYSVLHHKGIYDMTDGHLDRDPAYTKALPVLSSIIEAYPEIEVIIDLHRDGVREDIHLVQDIDGKQTARIMYFNGLCRDETGERIDISNPYREANMAMSLQLALTTMTDYPGLTRCIYLKSSRYNLHLRPKSVLIELGAQTNTVEEAKNAVVVLADVINKVLTN